MEVVDNWEDIDTQTENLTLEDDPDLEPEVKGNVPEKNSKKKNKKKKGESSKQKQSSQKFESAFSDDDDDDDNDDGEDENRSVKKEDNNVEPDEDGMVRISKKEFEQMFGVKAVSKSEMAKIEKAKQEQQQQQQQKQVNIEPILLVNWTRLSNGTIKADPTGAANGLNETEKKARDAVIRDILQDFETKCEQLFSQGLAYHSDTSTWDRDLEKLENRYPEFCWGPLGYPQKTGNVVVKDAWNSMFQASKWSSVTALKKSICGCSRGLVWKMILIEEIERLARTKEEENLQQGNNRAKGKKKKLTPEEESQIIEKIHPKDFSPEKLNILDKIIAMVFERVPVLDDDETHFQTLAKKHYILKRLWYVVFGSLPQKV